MAEFISAIEFCSDTDCTNKDCFIKRNGYERLCTLTSYYSSGAKQWLRKGYKFIDSETQKELGIFKNALALVLFRGVENADI